MTTFRSKHWGERTPPSLAEALRALRLRKGLLTEADIPRTTPLPGKRAKVIPGEMDIFGAVHDDRRDGHD